MKSYGYDVTSLFSNLNSNSNSNNLLNTINLSDYASIKSGNYGKLVKSYYADQKKTSQVGKDTDKTTDKDTDRVNNKVTKATEDKTGLTKMKSNADKLKSSTDSLASADTWKTKNGEYDMAKITSAVKDFADGYNNTLTQAAKVNSKDISQDAQYMKSMTSTMSKALEKVGITVADDGKLTINEDELKNASGKELKALFSGAGSYGAQIGNYASDISRDAIMNSSTYASNGTLSNSMSGMFNQWI